MIVRSWMTGAACAVAVLTGCPEAEPPEWRVVYESLDSGWLLSAWGSGRDDVWMVGGLDDRALVLRFDGESFVSVNTEVENALQWWVWGSGGGDVFVVGEKGSLMRGDSDGLAKLQPAVASATHYGVWGSSAQDVWVVGVEPVEGEMGRGLLLHSSDGAQFERVDPIGEQLRTLFKVWGTDAGNVLVVGEPVGGQGLLLRYDGLSWSREEPGTTEVLISVHGCGPDDLYAVGGFGNGVVVHFDGGGWSDISPRYAPQISGVHCHADGTVRVVGSRGYMATRDNDGWTEHEPLTGWDLHGTWGADQGFAFALGGNLLTGGVRQGVLVHYGAELEPTEF